MRLPAWLAYDALLFLIFAFARCTRLPSAKAITPDGNTLRTLYARYRTRYHAIPWPHPTTY